MKKIFAFVFSHVFPQLAQAFSVVGNITATGPLSFSSNIRFKKEIQPIENAIAAVLKIQPIYYRWKRQDFLTMRFCHERQPGFSAQEVEGWVPEIIHTDAQGYKAVDYSRLTLVLVQDVKEQQAKIEAQEKTLQLLTEELKH
ncbi:MAG TPA: tail fiber domain-containing protein [Flavisolibacter sp.]|nr:tail fiber domain-containing protein [Flavisolibacter sp.]